MWRRRVNCDDWRRWVVRRSTATSTKRCRAPASSEPSVNSGASSCRPTLALTTTRKLTSLASLPPGSFKLLKNYCGKYFKDICTMFDRILKILKVWHNFNILLQYFNICSDVSIVIWYVCIILYLLQDIYLRLGFSLIFPRVYCLTVL